MTRLAICLTILLTYAASADLVTMKDGRSFEGALLASGKDQIRFRAVLTYGTVVLNLPRNQITSFKRQAVKTQSFADQSVGERKSDPENIGIDDTLYLVVPVSGVFGKDIYAIGFRAVLRYARAHGIQHIVFELDTGGGDLTEARNTYRVLQAYREFLTYHAIIRRCAGDALVVPLWCDSVHILPGATVGGSVDPALFAQAGFDEQIVRSQTAKEAALHAERMGRRPLVARAMLDPSVEIAAWQDAAGGLQVARSQPADCVDCKTVFAAPAGELLVLNSKQATMLGVRTLTGGPAELGAASGFDNWKEESDYGRTVMLRAAKHVSSQAEAAALEMATAKTTAERAAARKSQQEAARAMRYDRAVQANNSSRQAVNAQIKHDMEQAATWDPSKQEYQSYSNRRYRGWGGDNSYQFSRSTRWSQESRRKWRDYTNNAIMHLEEVTKGIAAMEKLEKEAVKLRLEPSFQVGELERMDKDIELKTAYLYKHRSKNGD
jgi:hypothetical protein